MLDAAAAASAMMAAAAGPGLSARVLRRRRRDRETQLREQRLARQARLRQPGRGAADHATSGDDSGSEVESDDQEPAQTMGSQAEATTKESKEQQVKVWQGLAAFQSAGEGALRELIQSQPGCHGERSLSQLTRGSPSFCLVAADVEPQLHLAISRMPWGALFAVSFADDEPRSSSPVFAACSGRLRSPGLRSRSATAASNRLACEAGRCNSH